MASGLTSGVGQQIGADLMQIRSSIARAGHDADILPSAMDGQAGQPVDFSDVLKAAVRGTDDKERLASTRMADVDAGKSDDLVGAMLASQEASLSFSMLMQVRNKVVGAMDDLIKMQL
ncbi:flagellar hook-basal body complex protein FliE [Jeongeupia chitinilytica]|uniref:Flagellar hook-basal body complex protein FliE n=1 Tax=Jeongeupia chitinilytica TaxID=1041641 RepID=A0ABQ3H1K6_9NEIS|nr:flagellar hook-basal body complex protein FliE [Jeongeupia chitinilytica]GHD63328.1 flagellar hook-basal body complex protein FliE [Jeongeupia chitinilytica]